MNKCLFLQFYSLSLEIPHHHHDHEALLTHSYCHGTGNVPLIGETIGQRLDKITELYPDREFAVFVDDNTRATYADFKEQVRVSL